MVFGEEELNIVICTSHLCNPSVIIVDPAMILLDAEYPCLFVKGGDSDNGTGKSRTAFFGSILKAS
jgi:hypothetical protein